MLEITPRAIHPPWGLGTKARNQRWAITKDFDEQDDEEADPAGLAIRRAEAAKKLCEAIKELSVADVEGPIIAAGWAMLSKSAVRALDFDARLTPSDTLQRAQEGHNGSTGGHPPERGGTQHCRPAPGSLGGCSLRAPSNVTADAAFLS